MRAIPTTSDAFMRRTQSRHFSRAILPSEDFYRIEPVKTSQTVERTEFSVEQRPAEELNLSDQSVDHKNIISEYQNFVSQSDSNGRTSLVLGEGTEDGGEA